MPHTVGFRKQRQAMWKRDPRCYYCRVVTVLPAPGPPKGPTPPNLATIDHLRPRHHPGRLEPCRGEYRRVLACHKCNNDRDRIERAALPPEQHWKMSGSVPLHMKSLEELKRIERILLAKNPPRKADRERVRKSIEEVQEAIAEREMCDAFQDPCAMNNGDSNRASEVGASSSL